MRSDGDARACALADGRVLLVGGRLFNNIACEAEIWDPANNSAAALFGFEKKLARQQKNLAKYRKKEGWD